MIATVLSIQVGRVQLFEDADGRQWESGIVKSSVSGQVHVGKEHLEGDEQSDLKHHGGVDKAVLGYSAEHFDAWAADFETIGSPDWIPTVGAFGENLTIAGQNEEEVCIGDVYQMGTCVLQVSQPRQPCWKLSRRWQLPQLAVQVQKTGRTGWYYRVVTVGEIIAGDKIELIDRPNPEWNVARAHAVMHAKPRNPDDDLELSQCPMLSKSWSEQLAKRARNAIEKSESMRLFGSEGIDERSPGKR